MLKYRILGIIGIFVLPLTICLICYKVAAACADILLKGTIND